MIATPHDIFPGGARPAGAREETTLTDTGTPIYGALITKRSQPADPPLFSGWALAAKLGVRV
jgi:hypothetical protein